MGMFVMGSSRPKLEETLEMKIAKRITRELSFQPQPKNEILRIENVLIESVNKGDYMDSQKKKWNSSFKGTATFWFKVTDGEISKVQEIQGFAQVKCDESIILCNQITAKNHV